MAHKHLRGRKKPKLRNVRSQLKAESKDHHSRKKRAAAKLKREEEEKKRRNGSKALRNSPINFFINNYDPKYRTLLIGEGNFSFGAALCRAPFLNADPEEPAAAPSGGKKNAKSAPPAAPLETRERLVATAFDDKKTLLTKYEDAKANIKEIKAAGAEICVGVDCTKLSEVRNGLFTNHFDRIVFNFPHLGMGEKDMDKNVREHKKFLTKFFQECCECLRKENAKAEVHVHDCPVLLCHPGCYCWLGCAAVRGRAECRRAGACRRAQGLWSGRRGCCRSARTRSFSLTQPRFARG